MGEGTDEPREPRPADLGKLTSRGTSSATLELETEVRQVLTANRLTILTVLIGIAVSVALGVHDVSWPCRVGIGAATFIGSAILFRIVLRRERTFRRVMQFAGWVLGGKG